ncbi:MAG: DUF2062 domain-containing protein [Hyphomicrobiales bacterium]
MRVALWPRRSLWRSIKYLMLRVLRLTASPHVIAMGVAAGSFASFTPFLGFHFVIAFAICFFTRGSYVAAATGTFFGNPLTFPFIWGAVLTAGRWVLYGPSREGAPPIKVPELSADMILNSFDVVWPVIKAMAVGSLPVGIPVAFVIYLIVRKMARIYQKSRLKMLTDRAKTNWAKRLDSQLHAEYEAELARSNAQVKEKTEAVQTTIKDDGVSS